MDEYIDVFGIIEEVENDDSYEVYEIKDFCIAKVLGDSKVVEVLSGEYDDLFLPLIDNFDDERDLMAFKMDYVFDNGLEDYSINDLILDLKEDLVGCNLYCELSNGNLKRVVILKDSRVNKEESNDVFSCDLIEVSDKVKDAIINQDEVVDKIVTNLVYNQKLYYSNLPIHEARLLKKNMLVFGKTGTGKTEIIRQIVSNFDSNIPLVIEDANGYTIDGYKGKDVSDMLRSLYREANYDALKACHGILVIDEIDKKLKNGDSHGIASTGVQKALLKLIEGGEFDLSIDNFPEYNGVVLDTSLISVVLLGHFEELYKDDKTMKNSIGFTSHLDDEKLAIKAKKYEVDDFVKIGMIPEFAGRINSIIKTNDMDINTIKRIIKESSISPLTLESKFYDELGVKVTFDEEFINKLAEVAYKKNTGARAIKISFDELIGDINFDVLSGNVKEISFEKGKVRKIGSKKVTDKIFN